MTKIEEPLEKGWLRQVMRDVQQEVAGWPHQSSFPKFDEAELPGQSVALPSRYHSCAGDLACSSRVDS